MTAPQRLALTLVAFALVGGIGCMPQLQSNADAKQKPEAKPAEESKEFFFCFWNVENLFDDKEDKRNDVDKPYDVSSAENATLRDLKYDRLATALMKMNGGIGPDVLACAEVENVRAAEMLKDALNQKLKDEKKDDKLQYKFVQMVNLDAGRHIAPCVISRVTMDIRATKLNQKAKLRILETHLTVNGHDLCLIASHWTSQLKQRDGSDGDSGREKYANTIYSRFRELNDKDIDTDVLICGDFNDTPDSDPVFKNLGAIADKSKVKPTEKEPFLLDLLAGKDPAKFGTIWYSGKPLIYDHIVVSPGMLDKAGWSVDPESIKVQTDGLIRTGATRREPWRFGDFDRDIKEKDRGFADHFPVTVKIKVAPAEKK